MRLGKPVQVTDGIYQIRAMGARVTVLVESNDVLLVDAGYRGSRGMITGGLKSLGLSLDQVGQVVVTHAHPDHAGGLGELVADSGMPVALHRLEADIVSGKAPLPNPLQIPPLAMMAEPILPALTGNPVPAEALEDGDVVPFRSEVRVVHVPGHTDGSIAFYLPEKKTIIVGDALQYKFARRLSPPAPGVTQNPVRAIRSLETLLTLDFNIMCFGHFPPMRGNPKEALRRLIEQHRSRRAMAWRTGRWD